MPRPRDHLANLAGSILDAAGEVDSPLRRENLADALEVLLGEPEVDKVIGIPLALWDVLRDLRTRLERVERASDEIADDTIEELTPDAFGRPLHWGDLVFVPHRDTLEEAAVVALGDHAITVAPGRWSSYNLSRAALEAQVLEPALRGSMSVRVYASDAVVLIDS